VLRALREREKVLSREAEVELAQFTRYFPRLRPCSCTQRDLIRRSPRATLSRTRAHRTPESKRLSNGGEWQLRTQVA
jgi:hypothetical protein